MWTPPPQVLPLRQETTSTASTHTTTNETTATSTTSTVSASPTGKLHCKGGNIRPHRCIKSPGSMATTEMLCTTMTMDKLKSFVFSVAMATAIEAGAIQQRITPTQPDWFQTSPDLYTGEFHAASLGKQHVPTLFIQALSRLETHPSWMRSTRHPSAMRPTFPMLRRRHQSQSKVLKGGVSFTSWVA